MDTAKDARILILEDALRIINEIVSNRKLKMHIDYAKLGEFLKIAGSLLYEVKYSYLDGPALANLEATAKIMDAIGNVQEMYAKAVSSGYKPSSDKEKLSSKEMDYALRTIESFPVKLQRTDEDPAFAVDILTVEISKIQRIPDTKNIIECRCTDGSRIWNIFTNIQDVKAGTKLACAVLPPVLLMGVISEAMFLGGEILPESTPLGSLETPPEASLKQARVQVMEIAKRMT